MKVIAGLFIFLSLSISAQSTSSKKSSLSHGEKQHNCDEPCLKCGHQEACKDTKGTDVSREKKEIAEDDHQDHQHSDSQVSEE